MVSKTQVLEKALRDAIADGVRSEDRIKFLAKDNERLTATLTQMVQDVRKSKKEVVELRKQLKDKDAEIQLEKRLRQDLVSKHLAAPVRKDSPAPLTTVQKAYEACKACNATQHCPDYSNLVKEGVTDGVMKALVTLREKCRYRNAL